MTRHIQRLEGEVHPMVWIGKVALGLGVGYALTVWLEIFLRFRWRPLWHNLMDFSEDAGVFRILLQNRLAPGTVLGLGLVTFVFGLCKYYRLPRLATIAAAGLFIGLLLGYLAGGLYTQELSIFGTQ
jgi:hypothetical protein